MNTSGRSRFRESEWGTGQGYIQGELRVACPPNSHQGARIRKK